MTCDESGDPLESGAAGLKLANSDLDSGGPGPSGSDPTGYECRNGLGLGHPTLGGCSDSGGNPGWSSIVIQKTVFTESSSRAHQMISKEANTESTVLDVEAVISDLGTKEHC